MSLLAQDPLFQVAWDEMEEDDRQELNDVKKSIGRQKSKAANLLKKQERAKAKAEAKAKAKAKTVRIGRKKQAAGSKNKRKWRTPRQNWSN